MEPNYDEDLSENTFFQELRQEHSSIFQEAVDKGWIICVPRCGSFTKGSFTEKDFSSHILIPDANSNGEHYRTIADKEVKVRNKVLTFEYDISKPCSLHLLFEEIFYLEDLKKYRIWCIERPLEQSASAIRDKVSVVTNLRESMDVLWTEVSNKNILKDLKAATEEFTDTHKNLEHEPLQSQRDLVSGLYAKCLRLLLKDSRLREKTTNCRYFLQVVKVAVETYVLYCLRKVLPRSVSTCTAFDDALLNKTIKNLHDFQPRDLNIRPDLSDGVIRGKLEISHLDKFDTVLGKIGCLRKTLRFASQGESSVSSDDLLSILIFLVIKSGIPNWISQLMFMKHFRFSTTSNSEADEAEFLITSLEAALEHVRSGTLVPEVTRTFDNDLGKDRVSLNYLFEKIIEDDSKEVQRILVKEEDVLDGGGKLCHPLCTCESCEKSLAKNTRSDWPTVHTRDDRGLTPLHVACLHNRVSIVDFLLSQKADVDGSDADGETPLHCASSRGHQNTLLLLLHANADPTAKDSRGNTPLHFAADYGHETCVKAILYFTEQMRIKLDVNSSNCNGDTALHHASKWGYANIVNILLDYGADKAATNRRGLSSVAVAHSCHITRILEREASPSPVPLHSCPTPKLVKDPERKKKVSFLEPVKESSPRAKKISKLLAAVAEGDIHLVSYYFGLETLCQASATEDHELCHPLCDCKKCASPDEYPFHQEKKAAFGVNSCNDKGQTALHVACANGHDAIVQLLLDAGADVNMTTRVEKHSPLHLACFEDNVSVVKKLLDCGTCNVDVKDVCGDTPLLITIRDANLKLVEILCRHGSNPKLRNGKGLNAMDELQVLMNELDPVTMNNISKLLKGNDFI